MENRKSCVCCIVQPRMRLDLPPGGFLRPPLAAPGLALAPPDGAGGCGLSFCSSLSPSTSSGQSAETHAHTWARLQRTTSLCYAETSTTAWLFTDMPYLELSNEF